jgi:hypothetical protein
MENGSSLQNYGHFSVHSQHQQGSLYDDGPYGSGVAEGWNFEGFPYKAGLDVTHFQPVSGFESEDDSAQSNFTPTEFTSSQSSSGTAFGYVGNKYSLSNWVPHEATEVHNWLPTPDAIAVDTTFRQESNNGDGIADSPRATEFVAPYDVRPPLLMSPSTIAFQQLCDERVKPSIYASQQGFEPLPDRESRENPPHISSLYVPPTLFLRAQPP